MERGIDAENAHALNAAIRELYGALDNDLCMLAAIGIRTTFDVALELLEDIDSNLNFGEKLDALTELGHIGPADKDRGVPQPTEVGVRTQAN